MTEQEFADKLERFKAAFELEDPEERSARMDEILEEMGVPEVI